MTLHFRALAALLMAACLLVPGCEARREAAPADLPPTPSASAPPPAWLVNLRTTRRINGSRYADLALDADGHAYVGSFLMHEHDRRESAYLASLAPDGSKRWEVLSTGGSARIYGLCLDASRSRVWVTGYFADAIAFDDCQQTAPGTALFLAQFDLEGHCQQLLVSQGSAIGFNCTLDAEGNVYVSGSASALVQVGDQRMETKLENPHFLAKFDAKGHCQWLRPMGGVVVARMACDAAGDVYLAGHFWEEFVWANQRWSTRDAYDQDVLLLKVSPEGELAWAQQVGHEGNLRYGYRSHERAGFLRADAAGGMWLLAAVEGTASFQEQVLNETDEVVLMLLRFRPDGSLEQHVPLMRASEDITPFGHALSEQGAHLIAANFQGRLHLGDSTLEGSHRKRAVNAMLVQLSPEMEILKVWERDPHSDATLRCLQTHGKVLYATGHFRQSMAFGGMSLEADSVRHELFMMKLPLP